MEIRATDMDEKSDMKRDAIEKVKFKHLILLIKNRLLNF
jgi:hypothetical protein